MSSRAIIGLVRALVLGVTVLGPAPAAALARGSGAPPRHLAPPGNPAVTQYLEDVPSAMGSQPPSSGGDPASTLSGRQRERLAQLGPNGRLLLKVDDATAPALAARAAPAPPAKPSRTHAPGGPTSGTSPTGTGSPEIRASISGSGSGDTPVRALLGAATGQAGGASGLLLPALVAAGLLLLALPIVRRFGPRRP